MSQLKLHYSRDAIDQTDKDVYSALIGGLPFFMHVNVTSFNFPVKGVVRKKHKDYDFHTGSYTIL